MLFQKHQWMICLPEFGVSRKSSICSTIKKDSLRKKHTNILDTITRNSDLNITGPVAKNVVEKRVKFMLLL